jgi:hypothetical protein
VVFTRWISYHISAIYRHAMKGNCSRSHVGRFTQGFEFARLRDTVGNSQCMIFCLRYECLLWNKCWMVYFGRRSIFLSVTIVRKSLVWAVTIVFFFFFFCSTIDFKIIRLRLEEKISEWFQIRQSKSCMIPAVVNDVSPINLLIWIGGMSPTETDLDNKNSVSIQKNDR